MYVLAVNAVGRVSSSPLTVDTTDIGTLHLTSGPVATYGCEPLVWITGTGIGEPT